MMRKETRGGHRAQSAKADFVSVAREFIRRAGIVARSGAVARLGPVERSQPARRLKSRASVCEVDLRRLGFLAAALLFLPLSASAVILLPADVDWNSNGYRDPFGLQEPAPLPAPPAPAEPRVVLRLRHPETLPEGFITIGDVADIEGKEKDLVERIRAIDLLASPKAGAKEFIFARRIDAALRSIGLGNGDFEIIGPDRIALAVPSQTVSMEELEAAINVALNDRAMKDRPGEVEAYLRRPPRIELPEGELEIRVADLDRPGSGFRNIQLDFCVDGEKVETQSLPVRVSHEIYGLVASRDLRQGETITEADLTEGLIPLRDRSEDDQPIEDAAKLVGSKVKRNVVAESPITLADVEWEPLLRQGSAVTLVHQVGSVSLTAPGILMDPVYQIGEKVRVRKLNSRDDLSGRAMPGGKVRIQ